MPWVWLPSSRVAAGDSLARLGECRGTVLPSFALWMGKGASRLVLAAQGDRRCEAMIARSPCCWLSDVETRLCSLICDGVWCTELVLEVVRSTRVNIFAGLLLTQSKWFPPNCFAHVRIHRKQGVDSRGLPSRNRVSPPTVLSPAMRAC